METIPPKVVVAISAAIKAYREEQESVKEKKPVSSAVPFTERTNLWAIAGRQESMLQRKIWQLRLY